MLLVIRFWVLPVSALIGTVSWVALRLFMRAPGRRAVLEGLFAGYLVALLYVVLFLPVGVRPDDAMPAWSAVNLIPARTIVGIVQDHRGMVGWQLVGNVVLFVPLGFLLPLLSTRCRRGATTAVAALAVSVSIELVQFAMLITLVSRRSTDVDDVLLNVAGAGLGHLLWRGTRARARARRSRVR